MEADETGRPTIKFHYLKSPAFHTIHSDGIIGGPTPSGGIHMAFFAERLPIPVQIEQEITPEGTVGKEVNRLVRDGVVRELGVDVVMSYTAATTFYNWLGKHIETIRQVHESARESASADKPRPDGGQE